MNPVANKVQIPIEILTFVQKRKLVKPFAVYMYLKCMCAGKIRTTDAAFTKMPGKLSIRDKRTIEKHLRKLTELNWIGYNSATGDYFIRGISFIRKQQKFKSRKAATFYFKDLKNMQAFVAGSIISSNIKAQQYYWEVASRGRLKSVTMKKGVTKQDFIPASATTQKPDYYGLGVHGIAKLLNCKPTRACELKQEAEKEGHIKTKKKFREIAVFEKSNDGLKKNLGFAYPEMEKKVRFRKVKRGGKFFVQMVEQLHDEIKPKVGLKKIKRFNHLN